MTSVSVTGSLTDFKRPERPSRALEVAIALSPMMAQAGHFLGFALQSVIPRLMPPPFAIVLRQGTAESPSFFSCGPTAGKSIASWPSRNASRKVLDEHKL